MFSPIANSTYIQNNYFGNRSFQTPCMGGNNFYNGSLFNLGFGGGFGACYPSFGMQSFGCMPSFGCQSFMPSFPMMGGCCNPFGGGFGMFNFAPMLKMFDMFSMLNTFNTTTQLTERAANTFSTLTTKHRAAKSARKEVKNVQINTSTNLETLKDVGYNAEKGEKLAKTAAKNVEGFNNKCAQNVREDLEAAGLANGERGNGHEYGGILSRNPNFKEIDTKGINLASLPGGAVLVYDRGVAGYSSDYGHVEITLGNGQAVSDGVTNNIRPGARVFVPV